MSMLTQNYNYCLRASVLTTPACCFYQPQVSVHTTPETCLISIFSLQGTKSDRVTGIKGNVVPL
uniref:Uncharacterized protein n=1 Tax=Octopus bimaculoides TaxID=37653 RepID=A0A0L8HQ96_OCTBM